MIKEIVIGSLNPAKIKAVQSVVSDSIIVKAVEADSMVSSQPFSDEETRDGAIARAKSALLLERKSDIAIGLEGGVTRTNAGIMLCNWGALLDKENNLIVASGAKIALPSFVATRLESGEELGKIMASVMNDANINKTLGAIGIFTNGLVSRELMFAHIVTLLIGQYHFYHNEKNSK